MDIESRLLDILFRQVSPEQILQNLKQRAARDHEAFTKGKSYFDDVRRNLFMDFAESTLDGYSENEQGMLCQQLGQGKKHWEEQTKIQGGFWTFLIQYGQETLVTVGGEPRCKPEKALFWRDIYLRLGQDTIVCPFLAYQDFCNKCRRQDFTWPVTLRINDSELYHILGRGIAENHNHINGGTQSFQVTWCRLMNYPEMIRTELKHFKDNNLFAKLSRGETERGLDLFERLELASLLRSILFRAMHRDDFRNHSDMESEPIGQKAFNGERAFYEEYMKPFSVQNGLCILIDSLRMGKGAQLDYPDGVTFCLDYVLDNVLIQSCLNSHIRVLAAERFFLYQCTMECMKRNGFSSFEQELFYLYLVLKCNFRSEMIQANNQTGFKNFLNYQDRKDDAWDENPYFWEAARMAINYRLNAESIVSLEGRLVPKAVSEINIEKAYRFDRAKLFADCRSEETWDYSKYDFDIELDADKFADAPYFFVYHFIKIPDDRKLKKADFSITPCRHQTHRRNLRNTAIGLMEALQKSTYLRNRMRAIDTSASELDARPEVFASVYRYIDGMQQKWNTRLDTLLPSSPMRISKTYHAGEDFLDIADGLRAIDEAIDFMALGPGDRIGHALAMGVYSEDHYRLKKFESVTTKQDRLDDLVWTLYRSKELGVQIDGRIKSELQTEAYKLFREIYGEAIDRNGWNCELIDYYFSMKIRCDDPSLYFPLERALAKSKELSVFGEEFDFYLLNRRNPGLAEYRNRDCVAGLYHYYHYGAEEGLCGKQIITCKISKAYMKLMRQMQDAMQRYVEERRIVIECNPSSNVLIGTFQRYDRHPVFRFNNRELAWGEKNNCAQLQVCINTDDLGVFDTSLEFEYALLEQALLTQKDDSGRSKYNARDVMAYLNDLREMGIGAVFPDNHVQIGR